ncbi:MAG TPA: tetratricopeptide repeat protein [Anaerolineae bacterium]|nr:tetratricopeptide repeat protein [Anaerolineae bacterium]
MNYDRYRRRSSPRRILLLLILVGIGVFLIANQNELRQQVIPPPTPTATRTAKSYIVEAESLAQTGNLKEAASAYIQATSLEPDNVDVLTTLARIMALTNSTAEAVTWAERAVQAAPKSAVAQAALAMALKFHAGTLALQGRDVESNKALQQALTAAKAAVTLDPDYPEGQAYLAEIYAEVGDLENAEVSIQKALGLDPNRSEVRRAQGAVLENEGRYTDAAEAYRQAIARSPNVGYLYLILGRAYTVIASVRDPSLWASALDTFKKGTQVDPTDVRLLDEWGWAYYAMDQYRDAQEILEKATQLDPQAWSPRSHLAATYFQRANYEAAIDSFKQSLQMMNDTFDADHYCVTAQTQQCIRLVQAYSTLGYAYRQLGQCAQGGLGAFRKALIIRPDNPTAQNGYNSCAEDLGTKVPRTPTPRP